MAVYILSRIINEDVVSKILLNTDSHPPLDSMHCHLSLHFQSFRQFSINLTHLSQFEFIFPTRFYNTWYQLFHSHLDVCRNNNIFSAFVLSTCFQIFQNNNQLSCSNIKSLLNLCQLWLMALISPRCSYIYPFKYSIC